MNPFTFSQPTDTAAAVLDHASSPKNKFIGGGTNLLDLMKEDVERPARLIDINHLNLREVQNTSTGGLRIGALVTNADAAYNATLRRDYPLLSDAILAGASPQLRNMATCGGNLLQRTRCYYFYDTATACNKREPGAGCDAMKGFNRIHAVFGTSDACIAVHPSDMCVALAALNAVVHVSGPAGDRTIDFKDFHKLPGDHPEIDTELKADELILAIELPKTKLNENFFYLKVRDRTSYAFALVSAAVAMKIEGGVIADARVALGGVAHKPWRDFQAEQTLIGARPTHETFSSFAKEIFRSAKARKHNAFKIELGQRVVVRAMTEALERKAAP